MPTTDWSGDRLKAIRPATAGFGLLSLFFLHPAATVITAIPTRSRRLLHTRILFITKKLGFSKIRAIETKLSRKMTNRVPNSWHENPRLCGDIFLAENEVSVWTSGDGHRL